MRQCTSTYGASERLSESARSIAAVLRHALQGTARVIGMLALNTAERHLMSLDDRTLRDIGLDPRDLPVRDQLARQRSETSQLSHTKAAMDYWR